MDSILIFFASIIFLFVFLYRISITTEHYTSLHLTALLRVLIYQTSFQVCFAALHYVSSIRSHSFHHSASLHFGGDLLRCVGLPCFFGRKHPVAWLQYRKYYFRKSLMSYFSEEKYSIENFTVSLLLLFCPLLFVNMKKTY